MKKITIYWGIGVAVASILLLAFASSAGALTAGQLLGNTTNCTDVARYVNDGVSTPQYDQYTTGLPAAFDFDVSEGVGYFVYCPTADSLAISGTPVSSKNDTLYSGWNLYGWVDSTENSTAIAVLGNITNATDIARYINDGVSTPQFDQYTAGLPAVFSFDVTTGEGYFIYTTAETTWSR